MELFENKRVVFEPFTHQYILDGEVFLPGVTGVMKDNGLSANYGDIDPEVLAHAAELGTQAHEAIEAYCDGKPSVETPLIKTFKKLGLNIVRTEYLVSDNETVASSIDLLAEVEDGVYDIIDMKRTSTVHRDALAWQLGIYRYLFLLQNPGARVRNTVCLPIKKGNKDDILADVCRPLVMIEPVTEEEVIALLDAVRNGTPYLGVEGSKEPEMAGLVIPSEEIYTLVVGASKIASLKAALKEAEALQAQAEEAIHERMVENNVTELKTESGIISLKAPSSRTTFDSTRFKKEHPDIYADYLKTSEVKGGITFKPNA